MREAEGMVWFHPKLGRKDAELLLNRAAVDGAFLVWHNGGNGRAVLSLYSHKQVGACMLWKAILLSLLFNTMSNGA